MASVWGIRFAVKETDLVPGTGDRYAPGYSGGGNAAGPIGQGDPRELLATVVLRRRRRATSWDRRWPSADRL